MFRWFAILVCVGLVLGLVAPVTAISAMPARVSAPMAPDCAARDGCCDTGALCAATCADRCLAVVPAVAMLPVRTPRSNPARARDRTELGPNSQALDPPVPRSA